MAQRFRSKPLRSKPSGWEILLRKMTPDEHADSLRGWAAGALRRRMTTGLGIRASELDASEAEAAA